MASASALGRRAGGAHGAGKVGATLFNSTNGTLGGPSVETPLPYAVAGDGALSYAAGLFVGAVSPSDNVAVLAGGTTGGSRPEFVFLLR